VLDLYIYPYFFTLSPFKMKKCPRCKLPLLEKKANECHYCGLVFEKALSKRPRILPIILVSTAAILLIAYLVAPGKLAYWVHRLPGNIKGLMRVTDNQGAMPND